MTVVLVLLSLVLLIGVVIAWELLRLRRYAQSEIDPQQLMEELSRLHVYDPMKRLLSDEDFHFVESHPLLAARWKRKLRLRRRRLIALYLRDIRRDFNRIWSICRLLAPMNPDPHFSMELMRQLVTFYGYYCAIYCCCWFGCYCYIPVDAGGLLRGMNRLGNMAFETLRTGETLALQEFSGSSN